MIGRDQRDRVRYIALRGYARGKWQNIDYRERNVSLNGVYPVQYVSADYTWKDVER